jgi:hypothetical protein
MAAMIMAVGVMISQAQKIALTTNTRIRANSVATAIAQMIRSDLRRISKDGWLMIFDNASARRRPSERPARHCWQRRSFARRTCPRATSSEA